MWRELEMAAAQQELMGTPDELFHWVPGEMVVVVRLHRRPAEDTQHILIEQIHSQLNALLAPYNTVLEPYGTHGSGAAALTLPPLPPRPPLPPLPLHHPLP